MTAAAVVQSKRPVRVIHRGALLCAALWLGGCATSNYGGPINGEQALSPEERRLQAVETRVAELSRQMSVSQAGREQKDAEELGRLRGLIEQLRYDFDQTQQRNADAITGFDARIKALEADAIGRSDAAVGVVDGAAPDSALGGTPSVAIPLPGAAPLSSAADEEAMYLRSFDLLKGGKYDDAIGGFKGMLAKYPQGNYADNAWYWSGESYYIKKDFNNALTSYRSLLEKFSSSPKVPDALLKTGIIQQEQKKKDAARAAYNRVIKEFPNSSAAIQARTRLGQLR